MLSVLRFTLVSALICISSVAFSGAPKYLKTHNETNLESNAYIDGTVPSIYPTKAKSTNQVLWNLVKIACHGHTVGNHCSALIKVGINTSSPVNLGYVVLDLATGEITPQVLSANGYKLTVVGLGETKITQE